MEKLEEFPLDRREERSGTDRLIYCITASHNINKFVRYIR